MIDGQTKQVLSTMNGQLRRSRTMKTNIDVVGRGLLLVCLLRAVHAASETDSDEAVFEQMESEIYAVLFPWFVQIIGVLAYYIISRYAHFVPSTAAMFIVGALIGFAVPRMEAENDVTSSAATWIGMEGKVLLLVFFPGLMFLEAYSVDFVLFVEAIWQILWLAMPMVLAGTILTALVANFMFDYGWSFDLCMTFGGILSATDPVAISILMKELGAPARLQVSASHS
jgi:NhaP-type Na+/H+ or K+/H+ antiporter